MSDLVNAIANGMEKVTVKSEGPLVTLREKRLQDERSPDWQDLPVEILLGVAARLHVCDVGRMQTVCKFWNSIIPRVPMPSFEPCCVVATPYDIRIYDTGARKWYEWEQFPSVPELSTLSPKSRRGRSGPLHFEVTSAAGSLVLLTSDLSSNLTVCNPLNKSLKFVHREPEQSFLSVPTLCVDNSAKQWKILDLSVTSGNSGSVLRFDGARQFAVYDSRKCSWDYRHEFVPILSIVTSGRPLLLKEKFLYYLAKDGDFDSKVCGKLSRSFYLVVYDLKSRRSEVTSKMLMPNPLQFAFLFESRGRVMILGGNSIDSRSSLSPAGVFVWQLNEPEMSWKAVGSMPKTLIDKFSLEDRTLRGLKCAASGDLVVMLEMGIVREPKLYIFNLATMTWSCVPSGIPGEQSRMIKHLAMFQPSMSVLA